MSAAVRLQKVSAARDRKTDLVVLAGRHLLREVLVVGDRRDVLKEAALVLLLRRQVDREAGVRAFEPSVHVAMADRRVAPRVDVDVRFLEELVRHGRACLRANVHADGSKGEAEAEQRAPHVRPDVAVPGGGRQCLAIGAVSHGGSPVSRRAAGAVREHALDPFRSRRLGHSRTCRSSGSRTAAGRRPRGRGTASGRGLSWPLPANAG